MSEADSEFLTKARCARDKLADQFLTHPEVSLIDIGYAPEHGSQKGEIVLRIHVRESWLRANPQSRIPFPTQIDSIPVVVMHGDYQLQDDEPAVDLE